MSLQQINYLPNIDGKSTKIEFRNKVDIAIMRIREFAPNLPEIYKLAFSGGKDSIVVYDLAEKSGVCFEPFYNWTGIDPPELLRFVKSNYPNINIKRPLKSIWKLIDEHCILPTRRIRFCCEDLKESSNTKGIYITGIRWQESPNRHKRRMFEYSKKYSEIKFIHPIIDWSEKEVWQYIRDNKLTYCELYDQGFDRLGCILCPYTRGSILKLEMERYPKYVEMWRRAAQRLFDKGYKPKGCASGDALFQWWLTRERYPQKDEAQCSFFQE